MRPNHYFAGGNTAEGFCSHFEDILPAPSRRRMYYLKGGPGVGKSTLMRRVGEAAEKQGLAVEYFHCSSDPDSLDGICLPERGMAMMDGTSPHVYDPVIPGARDTLISLGDFLDEAALRPHTRDIAGVQQAISARFARCYRYLAAALQVQLAAVSGHEEARKAHELAASWAETLPLRGGTGRIRRLFASAYTPKGCIDVLGEGFERCVAVDCPFGLHPTQAMERLAFLATLRGLNAIVLANPLSPAEADGVLIAEHGILFRSGRRLPDSAGEWVEAGRLFSLEPASEKKQGFDRNAYELLIQRALEQLTAAKSLHDELEGYYVGRMDFQKWQGVLDEILRQQE